MFIIKTFENHQEYNEPRVIKWESLKSKVIKYISDNLTSYDFTWNYAAELLLYFINERVKGEKEFDMDGRIALYREIRDDLISIAERWDIREVSKLIEMYPKGVPDFVKNGNYTTELTDDGWVLIEKI